MDSKFPIKGGAFHSKTNSIVKSFCNTNKEILPKDIPSLLIYVQPHPLIIDDSLAKILSPIGNGEFNRLTKLME